MEELLKQFMLEMKNEMKQMADHFDKRFDKIENDIKVLKDDVLILKDDVSILKDDVSILKETVNNNQTENRSHFQYIESKLDDQTKVLKIMEKEIKHVRIDVDYLNDKTDRHENKINSLNKRIQL